MTDNDVSCFAHLRKAFLKWHFFNGNTKVIKTNRRDKNIDIISDTKIQLLLYNNEIVSTNKNININEDDCCSTINVPISFHADMELSQSQSGATNDSKLLESEHSNSNVNNNDKRREEIEFKENKSVSIEIGSGNKHNIRHHMSSESIGSTVVMEKRHKRGEEDVSSGMDFIDSEQNNNVQVIPK